MKIYYKNDKVVERPKSLYYNGRTYVPPTDELLVEAGYTIVIKSPKPLTNENIKSLRAAEYAARADQHFLAYQAYTELGNTEKAEQEKKIWLEVRQAIDEEFPYIDESQIVETEDVIMSKEQETVTYEEAPEFS